MKVRRLIIWAVLVASVAANAVFAVRYLTGAWPWTYVFRAVAPAPTAAGFAYRARGPRIEPIAATKVGDPRPLPDRLIIPPGDYAAPGGTYSLREEGLYRFVMPGKANAQRIVFDGKVSVLASSLAWVFPHGNRDDGLAARELERKALSQKLTMTCEPLCRFAQGLLKGVNVRARVVAVTTLEPRNNYDDSHTLLEVFDPAHNRWIVCDIDNNVFFDSHVILVRVARSPEELASPLSLVEFVDAVKAGGLIIEPLSADTRMDVGGFRDGGFDWAFFFEKVQADLPAWYRRVAQVALMRADGVYYFCDETARTRLEAEGSHFRYMRKEDFTAKFYPEQTPPSGE